MMDRQFKVHTPMHSMIGSLLSYGIIVALVVFSVSIAEITVAGLIIICVLMALLSAGIFMAAMLCVRVDDSFITVRTILGKKYKFSCTDIVKIVCSQNESTRQGMLFFITVTTEQVEFTVDGHQAGFDTFAGYLLEKLSTDEIVASAASESCKRMLHRYRSGVLSKKRSDSN